MKLFDIKPGSVLVPDAGFPCLAPGARLVVGKDEHGLFVPCTFGRHYLDSDEHNEVVGFHPEWSPIP